MSLTGIGIGLFILLSIWLIAFVLCVISVRTQKRFGFVAITIASLITIILLLIPVDKKDYIEPEFKESDYHFVWSNVIAVLLGASCLFSVAVFFTNFCVEPLYSVPVCT